MKWETIRGKGKTCAADSVNVILMVIGGIIVDNHNEVLDVQPTGCHGGCNQEVADVSLEVVDRAFSVHLILATMQRQAGIADLH